MDHISTVVTVTTFEKELVADREVKASRKNFSYDMRKGGQLSP